MRICTWNCNMAFRKKYKTILSYDPDILIVPECENPDLFDNTFYTDALWIGKNRHKGLGVFSFHDYEISIHEDYTDDFFYALLVRLESPENLNFLALWAMNNLRDPMRRYVGEVWLALQHYQNFFDSSTVIAGDFNWNVIWDHSGEMDLYGNFTDVNSFLGRHGIRSLYHTFTGIPFGRESDPTLYHRKNRLKSYHVDYIFSSSDLLCRMKSLKVGRYDDWISLSDHMPILATFQ